MTLSVPFSVGEVFEDDFAFTAENIPAVAALLGDPNPIHYTADPQYGALVACGGQITGLAMSFAARSITQRVPGALGRTWNMRFRAPVLAGDTMHMIWRIAKIEPHRRGTLLHIEGAGTVRRGGGEIVALTAEGTAVLLAP